MASVVLTLVDDGGGIGGVDFMAEFTPPLAGGLSADRSGLTAAQLIGLECIGRLADLISEDLVTLEPSDPEEG